MSSTGTTTTSNKRKRSDEEDSANDGNPLLSLPATVHSCVLRFLPHAQRLPLAVACRSGLKVIEEYSRNVMDKIYKKHFVDKSFERRLAEQFKSPPLEGGTPPHRVRLTLAPRLHLYKIARNMLPRYKTHLKLSPCEKYLLLSMVSIYSSDNILSLWDLETREVVWAEDVDDGYLLEAFFVDNEMIVACQPHKITVYSMNDGQVTARHALPEGQRLFSQRKRTMALFQDSLLVYFARDLGLDGLDMSVLNISSGVCTSVPIFARPMTAQEHLMTVDDIRVLANRWLVVLFHSFLKNGTFFRIYDGQNGFTERFRHLSVHNYDSIHKFQGDTLMARRGTEFAERVVENTIDVFKFNEASLHFYRSNTFDIDPSLTRTLGVQNHALHLHGGGIERFTDQDHPSPTRLLLYNMETGERENKFYSWHPSLGEGGAVDCVVSQVKQELFVGTRMDEEEPHRRREVTFLAAFLLKEPLLEDE